jgi:hypothetical protein
VADHLKTGGRPFFSAFFGPLDRRRAAETALLAAIFEKSLISRRSKRKKSFRFFACEYGCQEEAFPLFSQIRAKPRVKRRKARKKRAEKSVSISKMAGQNRKISFL